MTFVLIKDNFTPWLDVVMDRLQDQRPALAKLVPLIRAHFERQFETQGNYASGGWAPLTPESMERRDTIRPLMLTGTLWASLTQEGARYGYAYIGPDSVRVGTCDPVAHLLDHGTVKMQARDIEGETSPTEVERYADLIADDLLR